MGRTCATVSRKAATTESERQEPPGHGGEQTDQRLLASRTKDINCTDDSCKSKAQGREKG